MTEFNEEKKFYQQGKLLKFKLRQMELDTVILRMNDKHNLNIMLLKMIIEY